MKISRKIFSGVVALLVATSAFGSDYAGAIVFLSGDGNIINPLTGSYSMPVDPGNKQFFENILQGGTSVAIQQGRSVGSSEPWYSDLITFYGALPGVTATLISGAVTGDQIAAVNLFIAPIPLDTFNASEIKVLNDFLTGGGSVFFIGDNQYLDKQNEYINAALKALGSQMSIINDFLDYDLHTATGFQIAADPFTAGVVTLTYETSSQVSGGTPLFFATEGQPFISYEVIKPVPEPSAMLFLGSGLFGLLVLRKKSKK